MFIIVIFSFVQVGIVFASESNGTIDTTYKYSRLCRSTDCSSYSTLNWKPTGSTAITITDSGLTGYAWGDEIGWINMNPTGAGVLINPSTGSLSGYAYSNTGGWINFNPTDVSGGTDVGVRINSSGEFTGWAWVSSARGGWMKFDCSSNNTCVKTDWRPIPNRTPSSGGGGGGGGGSGISSSVGITLSGRAFPSSKVTVLKDGQFAISTVAGPDARFKTTLTNLSSGTYIFTLYTEDENGKRSGSYTVPVEFTSGSSTEISGIFLAPSVAVDKSQVKYGENIAIFGQSVPAATVTISIHSPEEIFVNTVTDTDGAYLYNLNTTLLSYGDHETKSKATFQNEITNFGPAVGFVVGDKTVLASDTVCPRADVNNDCRVNLVDFSIVAFWYKRQLSQKFALVESQKLNGDGKIDLVDFSIMAYYWTG